MNSTHLWFPALYTILSLVASRHVLLHKREPRSALVWLVWVWLFPIVGPLVYFYLGVNEVGLPPHRVVPERVKGKAPSFDTLAAAVAGTPLRRGNQVRLLVDGTEGYPAMLGAIRRARSSVDLQTYIFDLDAVGEAFLRALEDAARRGVSVRVLVDGMGASGARGPLKTRLKRAGGESRHYSRLDWFFRQPLLNLRNHRKLLVVDGRLAFTGGLNISQRYAKGAVAKLIELSRGGLPAVRDVHFAVQGPLVADLGACFQADWKYSGGLAGPLPAPKKKRLSGAVAGVAARVVRSGPDEDRERIYEVLLGALALARRSVDLCTPYFVPDAPLLAVLRMLGYQGVRVRLFVPRVNDHTYMHWAGQEYYDDLLDAGVEIWEVGQPFIHSKLAVVDAQWVFFGSSNLDTRSFRLNFELNVEARSRGLASRISALLEGYRAGAKEIGRVHTRRPAWKRLRGALINLAAPYL